MVKVERSIEVPVPRETFFRMISDYRSYPEFVSGLHSSRILEAEGRRNLVEFSAHLLKDFTYQLELIEEPPSRLSWSLADGPLRSMDGHWELEPCEIDGETGTRARYHLAIEAGFLVPKFAMKLAFKVWVPRLMGDYEERAKMLYEQEQGA